jgi:peptidylprolyl isomerase
VTTDMTVTADYLGEVYGAKKPFDESYSKKPVPFALTSVVQGWTYGLNGLKVGSRVLLQIPPALGYGDQAQSGIPPGSTLYFVIDIRKAK